MYYLHLNNKIVGPLSLVDLLDHEIQPDTLILIDGSAKNWTLAKNLLELNDLFKENEEEEANIFKIKQGDEILGTFDLKELNPDIINKDTLLWTEGMNDWQNAYEFLGLDDLEQAGISGEANSVNDSDDQQSNTYYIKKNNEDRIGPLNIEQIREIGIDESTLIWTEGMPNWINATDFLNSISSPPPLPVEEKLGMKKLLVIASSSIVILLLIAFFTLPYFVKQENDIAEKIYNSYNKATVLVYNKFYYTVNIDDKVALYIGIEEGELEVSDSPNSLTPFEITGSGFFISHDGEIITNRHVAFPWKTSSLEEFRMEHPGVYNLYRERFNYLVEQGIDPAKINLEGESSFVGICENNSIINDIGDFKECTSISHHKDYKIDLAKLQLKNRELPKGSTLISLENLEEIENVKVGSKICVLGFPGGLNFQDVKDGGIDLKLITNAGEISKEVTDYNIMFNAASAVGASGSPVFNIDGHLIGVHYAGQKGKQGFNYAISSKYILDLD